VLSALLAAVMLPASVLRVTNLIDNDWGLAMERSKRAGEILVPQCTDEDVPADSPPANDKRAPHNAGLYGDVGGRAHRACAWQAPCDARGLLYGCPRDLFLLARARQEMRRRHRGKR